MPSSRSKETAVCPPTEPSRRPHLPTDTNRPGCAHAGEGRGRFRLRGGCSCFQSLCPPCHSEPAKHGEESPAPCASRKGIPLRASPVRNDKPLTPLDALSYTRRSTASR